MSNNIMHGKSYINGAWLQGGGEKFLSLNPATGQMIWQGHAASQQDINAAVGAAQHALPTWSIEMSFEERLAAIKQFQLLLEARKDALAEAIAMETGKALWDAKAEVGAMVGKLGFSVQAYRERTGEKLGEGAGFKTAIRYKPHGVVAVYGPYNFPAHLPNGHIIPALLAGNVVIFKPSELTPLVAEKYMECWHDAGIPRGVVGLIQGERETGKLLSQHEGLDGLFFTGSSATGKILHQQFADAPHKILALELGGNNPLIIHEVHDAKAAAYHTIQSAYMTTGQRCTCARRLILPKGKDNDAFLEVLVQMITTLKIGAYTESPEVFMGPLISNVEANRLLDAQKALVVKGGKILSEMRRLHDTLPFVSPALIDVTGIAAREDVEFFGPLLQVIRVENFDAAIVEANNTKFGLSAAIFTDTREYYDRYLKYARAGVVNWNRPTTGSSPTLPFGGIGLSGNHHPAAFYSADYCAYPVASNEADTVVLPAQLSPGIML